MSGSGTNVEEAKFPEDDFEGVINDQGQIIPNVSELTLNDEIANLFGTASPLSQHSVARLGQSRSSIGSRSAKSIYAENQISRHESSVSSPRLAVQSRTSSLGSKSNKSLESQISGHDVGLIIIKENEDVKVHLDENDAEKQKDQESESNSEEIVVSEIDFLRRVTKSFRSFHDHKESAAFADSDMTIVFENEEIRDVAKVLQLDRQSFNLSVIERDGSSDTFTLQSVADEKEYVLEGYDDISTRQSFGEDAAIKGEPISKIDRHLYYKLFKISEEKLFRAKYVNVFLQKRLIDYYTRKRMWHVLKETPFQVGDVQSKYEQKLDFYEEAVNHDLRERENLKHQIADLQMKKKVTGEELKLMFERLQSQELHIAKDLEDPVKGRSMQKVAEYFLRRQRNQHANLIKLRMSYIIIRNKLQNVKEELRNLDHLGPGFTIMDYEQLKIDNRNLKESLEEKENELSAIRKTCNNNMQILAHRREKSANLTFELEKLKEDLNLVTLEYEDVREHIMYLKHEKQNYRNLIEELREKTGLLMKPKLLCDMANSLAQIAALSEQVTEYRDDCLNKTKQVRCVRKRIESIRERRKDAEKAKYYDRSDSWYNLGDAPPRKELKISSPIVKKIY